MIEKNLNQPLAFVNSMFRSGSTFVYQSLKKNNRLKVFHEPFHEILQSIANGTSGIDVCAENQLKQSLRHHFLDGSYFDEFRPILAELREVFSTDFSYQDFFLGAKHESPALEKYIALLCNAYDQPVVLQCTRTWGRLSWFANNYPQSALIALTRNPWSQWYSYKVDRYIDASTRAVLSARHLPMELKLVCEQYGFEPIKSAPAETLFDTLLRKPVSPDVNYALFFATWAFSYKEMLGKCNVILDMDALSSSKKLRLEAMEQLEGLGIKNLDLQGLKMLRLGLDDAELHRFEKIELDVLKKFSDHDRELISLYLVQSREEERRLNISAENRLRLKALRSDLNTLESVHALSTNKLREAAEESSRSLNNDDLLRSLDDGINSRLISLDAGIDARFKGVDSGLVDRIASVDATISHRIDMIGHAASRIEELSAIVQGQLVDAAQRFTDTVARTTTDLQTAYAVEGLTLLETRLAGMVANSEQNILDKLGVVLRGIDENTRQADEFTRMSLRLDHMSYALKEKEALLEQKAAEIVDLHSRLEARAKLHGYFELKLQEANKQSREYAKNRKTLDAIVSSRSWRITSPLRSLANSLRRYSKTPT